MSRKALLIAMAMVALALTIAGCAGPKGAGTLNGRDVFDPDRFSEAIYAVSVTDNGSASAEGFIVAAHPGEADGDRLTSVAYHDNVSRRADVVISPDGRRTLSSIIAETDRSELRYGGGSPTFNMTTNDPGWNTLDDVYREVGTGNVTTPSGTYDGCTIYSTRKTIYSGGQASTVDVSYDIHPSSPVPVRFAVKGPSAEYVYALKSVYLPGDTASTPERVIHYFFDSLDRGRLDDAFKCLIMYDNQSGRYVPPDNSTYRQFLDNQSRTYKLGAEGYRVQYVDVASTTPFRTIGGDERTLAQWESVHYQLSTLSAYHISNYFFVKAIDGQWRIIV